MRCSRPSTSFPTWASIRSERSIPKSRSVGTVVGEGPVARARAGLAEALAPAEQRVRAATAALVAREAREASKAATRAAQAGPADWPGLGVARGWAAPLA